MEEEEGKLTPMPIVLIALLAVPLLFGQAEEEESYYDALYRLGLRRGRRR
tara:strand:- start:1901 stop:2050 length:150 start_codon:yes stop_codon:yes gene_type:complete